MVDNVLSQPEGKRLMLLAPIIKERKGEHTKTLENLASQGYIRARIDGEVCDLSDPPKLELQKKHTIEVVIDRFKVRDDLARVWPNRLKRRWNSPAAPPWCPIWTTRKRKSCSSPPTLPARFAATACASWNRACSRSTTRRAPARPVTVWASSSISTRTA
jgi:hypothetical protein